MKKTRNQLAENQTNGRYFQNQHRQCKNHPSYPDRLHSLFPSSHPLESTYPILLSSFLLLLHTTSLPLSPIDRILSSLVKTFQASSTLHTTRINIQPQNFRSKIRAIRQVSKVGEETSKQLSKIKRKEQTRGAERVERVTFKINARKSGQRKVLKLSGGETKGQYPGTTVPRDKIAGLRYKETIPQTLR